MKRNDFDVAAGLVYRIDKIQKTIFELQSITKCDKFKIIGELSNINSQLRNEVELNTGDISTEVFSQDILEYFINTLNLELNELRENFDNLFSNEEE